MKKKLIILGYPDKSGLEDTAGRLRAVLSKDFEIVGEDLTRSVNLEKTEADLAVVIGGDGSILATARRMRSRQIPILGVNKGKFGFLAAFSEADMANIQEHLTNGNAVISERMMLRCELLRNGVCIQESLAPNDVVVGRTQARMIRIKLYIDGEYAATHFSDGLVVATPTGSTAYSLSAGGPIIEPGIRAFLLTPICPHTLTNRPLVVSSERTIEIEQTQATPPAAVTIDGQVRYPLELGDRVRVTRSPYFFKLIVVKGRSYIETLRQKFDWGGPTTDVTE
jgi:NAD+ kinase